MISKWILRLDKSIESWGEPTLTILLLLVTAILLGIVVFGKPLHKAAALIWVALP